MRMTIAFRPESRRIRTGQWMRAIGGADSESNFRGQTALCWSRSSGTLHRSVPSPKCQPKPAAFSRRAGLARVRPFAFMGIALQPQA